MAEPQSGEPNIESLREWLATWPDSGHWADDTGTTVPVTRGTLRSLLDRVERQAAAMEKMSAAILYHEAREVQLIELLDSRGVDAPAFEDSSNG